MSEHTKACVAGFFGGVIYFALYPIICSLTAEAVEPAKHVAGTLAFTFGMGLISWLHQDQSSN